MKTILRKTAAVLLTALMIFSALSCRDSAQDTKEPSSHAPSRPEETSAPDESQGEAALPKEADVMKAALTDSDGTPLYRYGEKGSAGYADADYTSLYAEYGRDVLITDVLEDPDTGLAYLVIDGRKTLLGLDFLSRAMVYNCTPSGDHPSEEDVYAAWWRYYVTRWNALLPEIPLYEETAVSLIRSEISGMDKVPLTPGRDLSHTLLYWESGKDESNVIIGSLEHLSGQFRNPSFDKDTPSGADLAIEELTNGLEIVTISEEGRPVWNDTVVHDHEEKENEDGSITYTITLWEDLRFSDGSEVTARDYLAFPLAFLSAVGAEADPSFRERSGFHFVGLDSFRFYEGDGTDVAGKGIFSGVRLLDEKKFSLTVPASDLPDANALSSLRLTAQYAPMWLGDAEILDDGEGCYLSDGFYERAPDGSYVMAEHLRQVSSDPEQLRLYPFSGPYTVLHYSASAPESVILVRNDQFAGDPDGQKASIETVIWKSVSDDSVYAQFDQGVLDIFTGIREQEDLQKAGAYAEASQGAVKTLRYGLGETAVLHFRADLGPVQFLEVRQALAYLLDRKALLQELSGGLGIVPDGPYTDNALYEAALLGGMRLRSYEKSDAKAVLLLEEGGWIYNAQGGAYESGVRYKKIPAELMNEKDRGFAASDGSAKAFEKDGAWYMPLAVNFFLTENTPLSDALETLLRDEALKNTGMLVTITEGSFSEAADELAQEALSGYYSGTPQMNAFDALTRHYGEVLEDDSVLFAIDSSEYELFNQCFFRDPADVVWLK